MGSEPSRYWLQLLTDLAKAESLVVQAVHGGDNGAGAYQEIFVDQAMLQILNKAEQAHLAAITHIKVRTWTLFPSFLSFCAASFHAFDEK